MRINRRTVILGGGALSVAALGYGALYGARASGPLPLYFGGDALFSDVQVYDAFGAHRTGSLVDAQTSAWMRAHLSKLGFATENIEFDLQQFEPSDCFASQGADRVALTPQWPVAGPASFEAPLVKVTTPGRLDNKIAFATFPYNKRASIDVRNYQDIMVDAKARGGTALIAITEGPTGQIIAMNAPTDLGALPLPVGLASPNDMTRLNEWVQSKNNIRFVLVGAGPKTVKAANTIGLLDRAGETIIVSTPISGWTHAGGERGPGVALWRAIATWAATHGQSRFVFLATSGHEFGHLGFDAALPRLRALVPDGQCKLWVHLGANIAVKALDKETPANGRWLAGTPVTLPSLAARFAGVSGLRPPIPATKGIVAGELKSILAAGFSPAIGIFGAGPLHHTMADRADATSPALLEQVAKPLLQTLMAWDRV